MANKLHAKVVADGEGRHEHNVQKLQDICPWMQEIE